MFPSDTELQAGRVIMKSLSQPIISEAAFSQLKHRGSEPKAGKSCLYCGVWATTFQPGLFTAMIAGIPNTSA